MSGEAVTWRRTAEGDARWERGQVLIRREVLNDGRCWLELPVVVVCDEPGLLATYIAEGAPLRFPPGDWPTLDGRHPWSDRTTWQGHGTLMLQRPSERYAVWVFWSGPSRDFDCWYVNMQEAFRRTPTGYDTQDLELDIVVSFDGSWALKDDEVLEQRIGEGRFTPEQVAMTRQEARRVTDALDRGEKWWSDGWASWTPDSLPQL
jgi:Protein of unknown function (DUF402)